MYRLLRYIAMAGNIVAVLWILRNGRNQEISSAVALIILLVLNMVLIYRHQKRT